MQDKSKNDIKGTLVEWAIAVICVLWFLSFNNRCSRAMKNLSWPPKTETAKPKPQQPQTHTPDSCFVRPATTPVKTR